MALEAKVAQAEAMAAAAEATPGEKRWQRWCLYHSYIFI